MTCIGENTEKYITFSVKFQENINDDNDDDEERTPT